MKRLRSIVVGMFLILAAAVPVFAVDGVETLVPGSDAYSTSWGNNAIYDHVAVLDLNTSDGLLYDIEKNTYKVLGAYGAQKYQKSIYKNRLVWGTSGIMLMDTDTLATRQISATGSHPSIYGDKVAYIKDHNVYLYDLDNDTEIPLTTNGYAGPWGGNAGYGDYGRGTDIYGDNVVWVEKTPEGVYSMALYNIWTKQSRTLSIASGDLVTGTGGQAFNHFDIYENYIVWNHNGTKAAYLYDLNTDTYSVLASGRTDGSSWFININNGKVVWDIDGHKIGVYDLKTKVVSKINTSSNGAWNPVTDGDKVLYPDGSGYSMFDITSPGEEVYSLNSSSSSVTVINPYKTDDPETTDDERIVATISTGAGPSDTALSPDETKLYILNSTDKTVTITQTYDQTYDFVPVYTVNINPTNKQTATAVAGDNDSNTYVALKNSSSSGAGVVKKITSAGVETTLTVGVNPNGLKISPDNKKLLVSNGSSSNVTAIDLATFTIIEGNISTGGGAKIVRP